MALPKINETLNFTCTIPSTGKRVKYRPYLVKEEKILLQAFESKDMQMCLSAMADTLNACLDPKSNVAVEKLATFDIEYLFTQVRSKSVGETSTILISCTNNVEDKVCGEQNEYIIDLDALVVEVPKGGNIIEITDSVSVEMKYPTYETLLLGETAPTETTDMANALEMIVSCIAAVLTADERIDAKGQSKDELLEFVNSMTATQLSSVTKFLETLPALKQDIEFKCTKCGGSNAIQLKGLSDFF